jgi:ParB family chromosome partitioning protein
VSFSSSSEGPSRPQSSKSRRGGLGRGLESLIPVGPEPAPRAPEAGSANGTGARDIPIDAIVANPYQPRSAMDSQKLDELAASIRTHGLMQPLIVTEAAEAGKYELIAGERRWRASRLAGLETVTVIVREATPQAKLELAIVENVVRADLSPLEEAIAYKQLIDDFGLSQADVAERVGKSRVSITNTLRILSSPEQVQEALAIGRISEGHARALLGLPSLADQVAALEIVLERNLNVRQTEDMVRKWATMQQSRPKPESRPAEVVHFEERLRSTLGTKVALRKTADGHGSTLTIEFYSDEQLQEFYNRLAGEDIW